MSDARVERVHEDRVRAREFLAQAERFATDAEAAPLDNISRAVLLHNAVIAACDAVLQAVGLRVTAGDRSHVMRIETALDQFDRDTEELFERLDAARERRAETSYGAGFVPDASVSDAKEAVAELIETARRRVLSPPA